MEVIGGPDFNVAGGDAREFSLPIVVLGCTCLANERGTWPEGGGVIVSGLGESVAAVGLG